MKPLLQAFGEYLRTESLPGRIQAGASKSTVQGYMHDINRFLVWWKKTEGTEMNAEGLRGAPWAFQQEDRPGFHQLPGTHKGSRYHPAPRFIFARLLPLSPGFEDRNA
jgi:hypothetical protein